MLFAAPAHAARAPYLTRAISDGGAFSTAGSARLMDVSLQRGARAGAQVARLPLNWALVQARRTPVDPTDPADPAYDFAETDALVRAAVRHGLTPLLRVGGAPAAHEAQPRWRFAAHGTWAPDPAAYGRFAVAVARRYSGRFDGLPRVRLYQAWNEPNLARFLQPQWIGVDGEWVAYSAPHYRRLLNAFYDGVKGVDRRNVVATAGTAPNGDPDGRGRMKPLRFWRSFLCLDAPCADPPRFDVLAHHPLTVTNPDIPARDPGNVGVADFHALKALLPAGQRCGSPRSIGIRAPRARPPSSCSAGCRTRCIACGAKAWTWSRGSSCATRRAGRSTRRACTRSIARPAGPAPRPTQGRRHPGLPLPVHRHPHRPRPRATVGAHPARRAHPRGRAAPARRAVGDRQAPHRQPARDGPRRDHPARTGPPTPCHRSARRKRDLGRAYGLVVLSVNVSVLLYVPVRSGSLAPMACLKPIGTTSLDTGARTSSASAARR